MEFKEMEVIKDVKDVVDKIKKLQSQKEAPTREGMIKALSDAKTSAPIEIMTTELAQGDTQWMPWDQFSNADLYRKLTQYQQGLINYCVSKIGKHTFEQLMSRERER